MAMLASLPISFHAPWNWPRVSALAGTLSLHVVVILILLIPATALQMLRPAAEPPFAARVIEPPPEVVEVKLPEPRPVVPSRPHARTPAPQPPTSNPHDNPVNNAIQTTPAEQIPAAHDGLPATTTDSAPTALAYHTRTSVPYPRDSLRLHEQGTVVLRVLVGVDGLPQSVEIEKSSGSRNLDIAARDAVRHWTFQPGTHDGIATALWARVPIAFSLQLH